MIYSMTFKTRYALIKASNMVYHALTFARSRGRCLKYRGQSPRFSTSDGPGDCYSMVARIYVGDL